MRQEMCMSERMCFTLANLGINNNNKEKVKKNFLYCSHKLKS